MVQTKLSAHAEVGEGLNWARRSSIKILSQLTQNATRIDPSTHHSLSPPARSTLSYISRGENVPSLLIQRQSFSRSLGCSSPPSLGSSPPSWRGKHSLRQPRRLVSHFSASGLLDMTFTFPHMLIVTACSDRRTSMHRLRIQLTTRRCLQGREVQHRNPSERAGHCGQRRLRIKATQEHIHWSHSFLSSYGWGPVMSARSYDRHCSLYLNV